MNDHTPIAADAAHTVKHDTIAAALARAQSQMGKALKSSANPHFKSRYADLSSVTEACMPALTANGIAVIQPFFEADGVRGVKTILLHDSGQTLETLIPVIVAKNDMQGLGSAITYARRYGLMCMAGIAPDDDDGNAASGVADRKREPERQEPQPQFDPQAAADRIIAKLRRASTEAALKEAWDDENEALRTIFDADKAQHKRVKDAAAARGAELKKPILDEVPY